MLETVIAVNQYSTIVSSSLITTHISNFLTLCQLVPHLLITFANSLDPVQARQNVGPDLDPNV